VRSEVVSAAGSAGAGLTAGGAGSADAPVAAVPDGGVEPVSPLELAAAPVAAAAPAAFLSGSLGGFTVSVDFLVSVDFVVVFFEVRAAELGCNACRVEVTVVVSTGGGGCDACGATDGGCACGWSLGSTVLPVVGSCGGG